MDSAPYEHESLSRPKEQIRLLQVNAGREGEVLGVTLQTWSLSNAPKYYAMSYTWGADRSSMISVNKRPFQVRRNCCDALWQARLHHPGAYIWVDSICINQDDLEEKSSQLPLMAKIYTKALWTLICVGRHEDNSQLVIESLRQMREANRRAAQAEGVGDIEIDASAHQPDGYLHRGRWHSWADNLDKHFLAELSTALVCFARRSYWSRLWVVQEIALSKAHGQLFCGEDALDWADMELMFQLVAGGEKGARSTKTFLALWGGLQGTLDVLQYFHPMRFLWRCETGLDLDSLLLSTFLFHCSNRRDHIYGILGMVEWGDSKTPIIPDYSISPFHLAMEVVARLRDAPIVGPLLDALGVHYDQAEMVELCAQRFLVEETKTRPRPGDALKETQIEVKMSACRLFRNCIEISSDESGCLTMAVKCDIHCTEAIERERERSETALQAAYAHGKFLGVPQLPVSVKCNGVDVALASYNIQAGDMIAPIHFRPLSTGPFLILRSNRDRFDIVGQGFFLPGIDLNVTSLQDVAGQRRLKDVAKESILDASLVFTLSVADILRLFGQDFMDSQTYSPEARPQRLVTCAVDRPKGAVKPVYSRNARDSKTDAQEIVTIPVVGQ